MRKAPPPVHLLDRASKATKKRGRAVCGPWVPWAQLTTMGWKVTCTDCNPPTRRRVRVVGRPSPTAPVLEDA